MLKLALNIGAQGTEFDQRLWLGHARRENPAQQRIELVWAGERKKNPPPKERKKTVTTNTTPESRKQRLPPLTVGRVGAMRECVVRFAAK